MESIKNLMFNLCYEMPNGTRFDHIQENKEKFALIKAQNIKSIRRMDSQFATEF